MAGGVRHEFRAFAAALLAAGWLGGCGASLESDEAAAAYAVSLSELRTRAAGGRSDRAWQRQTLEDALDGAAMFRVGEGADAIAAHAEITERRDAGGIVVRLQLGMEVPPDLAGVVDTLEATVEVSRAQGDSAIREDLPLAAERAAAVLDANIQLARTPQVAPTFLRDPDAEIALVALDWVETQRDFGAAPVVASMLHHPDDRVMLRSVEVLGVIGSAAEVPALIAAARLNDRAHTGRLYEALAALGGPDAQGFLSFAARNEDDPALAQLAERALDVAQRSVPRAEAPPVTARRGHR